jgi:hypothetical protein
MTTRLLPPAEWSRLAGTELEQVYPLLDPMSAKVLVVEQAGIIVACWALIPYLHVEGMWLHPMHRRTRTGLRIWQELWAAMRSLVHVLGERVVLTAACTDDVRSLINRLGGRPLPGDHYVIPIGGA